MSLSTRLAGTDFRVVAISVDKDKSDVVLKFAKDLGLNFDILQDPSGTVQKTLQTTGVPESFVIDRQGIIIKKVIGAEQWDAPVNETMNPEVGMDWAEPFGMTAIMPRFTGASSGRSCTEISLSHCS